MQLQLTDIPVGEIKNPSKWNQETQRNEEVEFRSWFLDQLNDRKVDYSTKKVSQSLVLRSCCIPEDAVAYHQNYIKYLEKCWGEHLGIVITPDIIWYILLCELTSIIKADPNQFRHLFSDSEEKKTIAIVTGSRVEMPLDDLVRALKAQVPTNIEPFMPNFSTTTDAAKHAQFAAFCDMCSPYYDYIMLACGFPAIDVRGTEEDWLQMHACWCNLKEIFNECSSYFNQVEETLTNCIERREDVSWWNDMFVMRRCGSGSQTEVSGWINSLFQEVPRPAYTGNYNTNISVVDYLDLPTQKKYKMQDGLFYSKKEGDFLVPEFGYTIHEKIKIEPESYKDRDSESAIQRMIKKVLEMLCI